MMEMKHLTEDELDYELGVHDCGQNPYCSSYRSCGVDVKPLPSKEKIKELIPIIRKRDAEAGIEPEVTEQFLKDTYKIHEMETIQLDFVRCDEKRMTAYQINEQFIAGTFKSLADGGELHSKDVLQLIDNLVRGIPFPMTFGGIQTEEGDIVFKSPKLRQIIDKMMEMGMDENLSPLKQRKIRSGFHIKFEVIPVMALYNPTLTNEQAWDLLKFHS